MNTFSPIPEITEDIEVVKEDGEVDVHIGDSETVGYNFTEDGVSITPDWTDKRFTLALLSNSAFFHVTQEGEDEWKREEARHISHEGLIAEFWDSIRNVGQVGTGNARPITMFDIDRIYSWDLDELKELFEERGIVEYTDDGVRINSDKVEKLMEKFKSSLIFRILFFRRILNSVSLEEAKKEGNWLYVSPRLDCFILIYPDGYACELAVGDVEAALMMLTSSRWGDAILQATDAKIDY